MTTVVVTRKYQVTIPRDVRKLLKVKMGDKLRVRVEKGKVIFEPLRAIDEPVEFLWGLANKYLGGPRAIDAVRLVEETLKKKVKGIH